MDKILSQIKIRILKYLEISGISRESFYRETGISASNFKGSGLKSELGSDKIAKILTCYPNLNSEWLLTGRGTMYAAPAASPASDAYPTAEEQLTADVSDATCPDYDLRSVPLYRLDPLTGLAGLFDDELPPVPVSRLTLPGLPACDGALRIAGDAMAPILKSGDIVLYKRVRDIPDGFLWGETYLVAFEIDGETYTVLRYVHRSQDDDRILLVSHDPHHAPKEIHVACIRAAALIRASVRYNTMG